MAAMMSAPDRSRQHWSSGPAYPTTVGCAVRRTRAGWRLATGRARRVDALCAGLARRVRRAGRAHGRPASRSTTRSRQCERYVGFGLVAALAAWYAVRGAPGLRQAGGVYLAVAAPLTSGCSLVAPIGALMLFALYPHVWLMLPVRLAIPTTAVVVAGVVAVAVGAGRSGRLDPGRDRTPGGGVAGVWRCCSGCGSAGSSGRAGSGPTCSPSWRRRGPSWQRLSREAGALAERERLAHEIHDTLAQGFTSVLLLLEAVEGRLDRRSGGRVPPPRPGRETARENLAESRALVAALTPPDLTRTSLPEALRRHRGRTGRLSPPAPRRCWSVTGTPRGLPPEHEVALLRGGAGGADQRPPARRRQPGRGVAGLRGGRRQPARCATTGAGFDPDAPPCDGVRPCRACGRGRTGSAAR